MVETDVCWCGQKQTSKNVDEIDWTDCGICRAISDANLAQAFTSITTMVRENNANRDEAKPEGEQPISRRKRP